MSPPVQANQPIDPYDSDDDLTLEENRYNQAVAYDVLFFSILFPNFPLLIFP